MPRFHLREFSVPNYAGTLPQHDPNNAIWPRISMIAKMLNEIPWFKKGQTEQEELSEKASEDMEGYTPLGEEELDPDSPEYQAKKETERMKGYAPNEGNPTRSPRSPIYTNIVGDSKDDVPNTYSLEHFSDEDIANEEMVKNIQKELVSLGYDLGKFGANKDGVDGKYGNATKQAYNDWKDKLLSDELDSATQWANGGK